MIRLAIPRGLGATYYSDSPPDAETLAILAARGEPVEYIERPQPASSGGSSPPSYDYSFPSTLEDCAYNDTECVLRRVAAVSAYQSDYSLRNAQYYLEQGLRDWEANKARYEALGLPVPPKPTLEFYLAANAGGGNYTPPAAPPLAAAAQPRVTFTNLTSGNPTVLYPGDRWEIAITGAPANAAVSVTGGKDGARDTTPMGQTDAAGNFKLTGTITADMVGAWSESWRAGGIGAGSFSFTVRAAAAPPPANTANGDNQPQAPAAAPPPANTANGDNQPQAPAAGAGFSFTSIPWYVWVIGAGLLIFAGGGGRR